MPTPRRAGAFCTLVLALSALGGAHSVAQQAVTTVAPITVRPGTELTFTPEELEAFKTFDLGIPFMTMEEAQAMDCHPDGIPRGFTSATLEFEKTKAQYESGEGTLQELKDANVAREMALTNRLGGFGSEALNYTSQVGDWPPGEFSIEHFNYRMVSLRGEPAIVVSAVLTNLQKTEVEAPRILMETLDQTGLVIEDKISEFGGTKTRLAHMLPAKPYQIELLMENAPPQTHDVKIGVGLLARHMHASINCPGMEKYHPGETYALDLKAIERADGLNHNLNKNEPDQAWIDELSLGLHGQIAFEKVSFDVTSPGILHALNVTATVQNYAPTAMRIPSATVRLLGAGDTPVGIARIPAVSAALSPRATYHLQRRLPNIQPLPAAAGRDPLELVKRVVIIPGAYDEVPAADYIQPGSMARLYGFSPLPALPCQLQLFVDSLLPEDHPDCNPGIPYNQAPDVRTAKSPIGNYYGTPAPSADSAGSSSGDGGG